MNVRAIQAEKAERVAFYDVAIDVGELMASLPADLPNSDEYDRDVARDVLWEVVFSGARDAILPELEPYAARLRQLEQRLAAKVHFPDAALDVRDLWQSYTPRELAERKDAMLAVYDLAIREREILDQLERRYGPSRYADQEVESFLLEQLDEERQSVAKLRRGRELELVKWDALIELFEGRAALKRRNGRLWEETDQASILADLLAED